MDEDGLGLAIKENVKGKIEFKNVWFRYPTRKDEFVMKGLSLVINPNERVALVGESGCGKSTFVNLLMRFYDIFEGEILLDDINIKDYNLHDLRTAISLVMQEPIIFNYSILENILYGSLNSPNQQVLESCQIANSLEFIENKGEIKKLENTANFLIDEMKKNKIEICSLIGETKFNEEISMLEKIKDLEEKKGVFKAIEGVIDTRNQELKDCQLNEGFNSQCGIKGNKLSGGQKQRLAIARTIIRKPKVLLLDEATSALDEDSQKLVQTALENATEGRTTIVIAHRMSTIERCDKVFVLEAGRVKEEGVFADLKEKGGLFAKLAEGQGQ